MLFFKFCKLRRLVFEHSSPVHQFQNPGGDGLSVTKDKRTDKGQKSSCLNRIQKNKKNIFMIFFLLLIYFGAFAEVYSDKV